MADFTYNGIPIFEVGFMDFALISSYLNNGGRLMSRNIELESLRSHYIKKGSRFGVRYEGIILEVNSTEKPK